MRALGEALKCHVHAIKYGFVNAIFITNNLIGLYSDHGSIEAAHKLFNEMSERNVYSWNTIINGYIKSRNLSRARTLFDSCPCRDTVTYNSMISGYARSGRHENEAIELLIQMQCEEDAARIDEFTLTTMLNMIAKLRVFDYGRQLHSFMVKSGNDLSSFALSSLIDMYSKCGNFLDCCWIFRDGSLMDLVVKNTMLAACFREGELEMAQNIFMIKPELNDNVSWNTMISGYLQNGHEMEAIESFKCMAEVGFQWNEHTFASLLVSSTLKSLAIGKEVHSLVLKEGMLSNPFISSGIVDIYCKCGNTRYAEIVHESFGMGNLFSTTSMIVGYSAEGDMIKARRLFDLSEEKNYVMWTAIITGYTKLQKCEDAFVLFRKFTAEEKTVPDLLILISLLGASAILASMVPGKQIHAYTIRTGVKMDEKASCALVDMYSKCGSIIYAQRVFERISPRDSVIYNVMIAGCAHHGYENEATNLFEEMMERGLQPDAVTFIALLSACRHRGLVEDGEKYFSLMTRDYGIPPEIDHYSCMIDLYVRSNQLKKALTFVGKVDVKPDSVMWSTFLNACQGNGNHELAQMAESKLLEIEGDNGARYVQLASVYASGGKWDEMGRVMNKMRGNEVKKLTGCSWLHVGSGVRIFTSGDRSHSDAKAIYYTLGNLTREIYDTDASTKKTQTFDDLYLDMCL
ncbi:putative pentatricopeptide repeat-containing protein At3g18840 [Primulina tabacum]|uniref:putative pentatricopeptide repeat-containing protein At3g18840 n=1 Tax=Primulina tabacum TaxID=48773 RepID=UPI003F5AD2A3